MKFILKEMMVLNIGVLIIKIIISYIIGTIQDIQKISRITMVWHIAKHLREIKSNVYSIKLKIVL